MRQGIFRHGKDSLSRPGKYIFVSFAMLRMRQRARIVRGRNGLRDLRSNGENFIAFDIPLECYPMSSLIAEASFDGSSVFFGFSAGSLVMIRLLLFQAVIQRIPDPPPGRVDHIRGVVPLG